MRKRGDQLLALTKRMIDAAVPRDSDLFLWDGRLAGFGCRVHPTGRKTFIAQVRVASRQQRRVTIGPYGVFTVEAARQRAETIIRAAADGRDPQREKQEARRALTVAELCERYLEAARAGSVIARRGTPKTRETVETDAYRIARHITPRLGAIPAAELRRSDVQLLADQIAVKRPVKGQAGFNGGPGAASRVVGLLGGIYSWAQRRGLVPDDRPNPAHGVTKAADQARDRVLDADELRALGRVLAADQSPAASALRLIAVSAMRRGEATALRWSEIDGAGRCLRLENTKSGRSVRPLSAAALEVLRTIPRQEGVELVFGLGDPKKAFARLFDAAGLANARSHDLRRTYASTAANLGYADSTIAEMIGHARQGVTQRHYIRFADAVLLAAADRVAGQIAALLDGQEPAEVVRLAAP